MSHWNQSGTNACVHAFIGKLADGTVATYQTLPWDCRGWHAGTGSKGSANNTHISFEICEDGLNDESYFSKVYQEAVELTAYLCELYGLNPLADGVVICHSEGHTRGIASNHADVMHWFPKFGKNMDTFRTDVNQLLKGETELTESQIRQIVRDEYQKIEAERAALPASDWAKPYIQQGIDLGITAENASGTMDRPQASISRQEVLTMCVATVKAAERK